MTHDMSADERSLTVSRDDLGADWPLTVDRVEVQYDGVNMIVLTGGTAYWLNGAAKRAEGLADLEAIWAPHPEIEGMRKSLSPLRKFIEAAGPPTDPGAET